MAFANDAEFTDDFRKVGTDVTASFESADSPFDTTGQGSSENLSVAPKTDDLEDDDEEDLEDEDDDEDDDLEDDDDEEDLEDDDEDEVEGEDDLEDDDEDLEDDDEDEDELDDELEDDDDTVKARNTATAASAVRSRS